MRVLVPTNYNKHGLAITRQFYYFIYVSHAHFEAKKTSSLRLYGLKVFTDSDKHCASVP